MLSTGSLYDGTDGTVLCAEKVVALKALKLALTPHSLSPYVLALLKFFCPLTPVERGLADTVLKEWAFRDSFGNSADFCCVKTSEESLVKIFRKGF
jgi:hypothetical protein